MLDLSKTRNLEVKLADGETIHLQMLTLRGVQLLESFKKDASYDDLIKAVEMILNNNEEKAKFTTEYIEQMPYQTLMALLTEYGNWMREVEKN